MTSRPARPAERSCTLTSRTMITILRRCTFVPTVGMWRCTRRMPPTRVSSWRVSDPVLGSLRLGSPERTLDHGSTATYSNLYPVGDGSGSTRSFARPVATPTSSCRMTKAPPGKPGAALLIGPGRPYARYAVGPHRTDPPPDTEQHPRSLRRASTTASSTTAGCSDPTARSSTQSCPTTSPSGPERLTSVFGGRKRGPGMDRRPTCGCARPAICRFSVHGREAATTTGMPRFDGGVWHTHFLAHAGSALYRRRALLHRPRGARSR